MKQPIIHRKSQRAKSFAKIFFWIILSAYIAYSLNSTTEFYQSSSNTYQSSEYIFNTGKSLQDELKEVEEKLKQNRAEQQKFKNQMATIEEETTEISNNAEMLVSQISLLNTQIQEKTMILEQLELQIKILEEEILELEIKIADTIEQIDYLQEETDDRILNMYLSQKQNTSTSSIMFSSDGPSALVKSDTYRQAMQEDTNKKLEKLKIAQVQLEKDKDQVEQNKIEVDKKRNDIEDQKVALDKQRTIVAQQREAILAKIRNNEIQIKSFEQAVQVLGEEEKKLQAQYDQIQSALLSRNEVANGLPIKRGTMLGVEGNTGYSYGTHLHFGVSVDGVIQNPCNYLTAYGCGGNGKLGTPLSGAILTSGYRTSSRPNHNAIDVSTRTGTGPGGSVVAAHDGYVYFFYEPCPSWAPVCNSGGAYVAKVCETNGCKSGFTTVYYHLNCTAEPAGSPRSCR